MFTLNPPFFFIFIYYCYYYFLANKKIFYGKNKKYTGCVQYIFLMYIYLPFFRKSKLLPGTYLYCIHGANGNTFPWKSISCVKAPKMVCFLLWTAVWVNILTIDNLVKKGLSLVGWCCLCQCSGEMVIHLLFHCDVTYDLWYEVFNMFGVQWVMPLTVAALLFG